MNIITIAQTTPSVRLRNALHVYFIHEFDYKEDLWNFLDLPAIELKKVVPEKLYKQHNVGRKTIAELDEIQEELKGLKEIRIKCPNCDYIIQKSIIII